MGFTEILTLIFIVLKLAGIIHWNWLLVILPEEIAIVLYLIYFMLWAWLVGVVLKYERRIK